MTTTAERVRSLVEPLVADLGASVYDVEHHGGVLRIALQRPDGLDLSVLTEATKRISAELDAADPIPTRYTLEVTSPGLERVLRTPAHFAGAVGERVRVKTRPNLEGDRRLEGELISIEGTAVTIRCDGEERRLELGDIERAQTHVDWSPPPKPGAPRKGGAKNTEQRPVADASDASGPESSDPQNFSTPQSEATS